MRLNSAVHGLTKNPKHVKAGNNELLELQEMSYKRHQTANRSRMSPRAKQANAPNAKAQRITKVRADTIQTAHFTEGSPRE